MLSQIFMLHSPIFVVLETFSSPCRAPAFPWKGQGRRAPFHTAMGFCPGFQMLWIIAAGIAHISIYFCILTKFANKKKKPNQEHHLFGWGTDSLQQEGIVQVSSCSFHQHFWRGTDSPTSAQIFFFFPYLWVYFALFPFSFCVSLSLSLPGGRFPGSVVGWVKFQMGEASLEVLWVRPVSFWKQLWLRGVGWAGSGTGKSACLCLNLQWFRS